MTTQEAANLLARGTGLTTQEALNVMAALVGGPPEGEYSEPENYTPTRTIDVDNATVTDVANYQATLVHDLIAKGLLG